MRNPLWEEAINIVRVLRLLEGKQRGDQKIVKIKTVDQTSMPRVPCSKSAGTNAERSHATDVRNDSELPVRFSTSISSISIVPETFMHASPVQPRYSTKHYSDNDTVFLLSYCIAFVPEHEFCSFSVRAEQLYWKRYRQWFFYAFQKIDANTHKSLRKSFKMLRKQLVANLVASKMQTSEYRDVNMGRYFPRLRVLIKC